MGRAAKKPGTGLTEKQEGFALECVRLGSPARAYRKCYDAEKMTQTSVWSEVNGLLANPIVAAKVRELTEVARKKLNVTVERIAVELARVAFFDPRELFDETGNPVPINELPEDAARVIAGLDVEDLFERDADGNRTKTGMVKKYKLSNKLTALEVLAKWQKMLIDRVETGKPGEFAESEDALSARVKERMVRLGLAKVTPIEDAKRKTAA